MRPVARNQFNGDGTPAPESAVKTETIAGDIYKAIIQKKEAWLEHHMNILLGEEVAKRAATEPAIVRTLMKERGIWLKDEGAKMTLMEGDKVISQFILEWKKPE